MKRFSSFLALLFFLLVNLDPWKAQTTSLQRAEKQNPATKVASPTKIVVAVSEPGAKAGLSVLKQGGNAVDAAVATALAMAVTHPAAGNIGGGGFMMIYPPGKEPVCIEYRETAPAATHPNFFKKGDPNLGHRVVGVPGTVRGLALAHERFGTLPWKALVDPAITLAEQGFLLDAHHANSLNGVLKTSADFAELRRVFSKPDGTPWKSGDRLIQPDLAKTLRLIAEQGPDAFYTGPIADLLVKEMKSADGVITHADLAQYKANARTPIHVRYRGYDVYGAPPPSSGGIGVALMLHMLEPFELKKHDRQSPETLHLLTEVMRRAYAERAKYLGDPAFTKIPAFLTTPDHAKKLAHSIVHDRASKSEEVAPEIKLANEGDSTTHFSVIDPAGMAVSNTYTLEQSYGSRVVVKGAGFLLNNEMLDFNSRPGITTRAGGIGTDANLIAPGKRMLSSQTPTLVAKDGKVVLVTGSPGGRTIINTVLNILVSVLDYDMPIQAAVDAPRLHHQWFPDEIRLEGADKANETVSRLKAIGHRVVSHKQGDAHSIWIDPRTGHRHPAADRRLSGYVAAE